MCAKRKKDSKKNTINELFYHNFLYLHLDFLESFIAQKYKGLPQNFQTESLYEKSEDKIGKQAITEASVQGKLDTIIKILKDLLSGDVNTKIVWSRNDSSITETKKNVISKTLNDDMYHDFTEYIEKNDMLVTYENVVVGKYIKIYDEFYYIDFDRLKKLYSKRFKSIHSKEKFDDIKRKIYLLSELIPFDALLYNSNFIVLIDQDWLKDKKEHIGYTLEGKINILGRVSKFIEIENTNDKPELINTLDEIQKYALSLLCELGFLKAEKAYLVTPIAIYY